VPDCYEGPYEPGSDTNDTGSRKILVDGRRRASIMPESSKQQKRKERE